ncbi:MAG TPA: type 1 glutamine amidotransferase domain-containing protein [Candidatus Binataceae bacterium]|jgi:protease I|nr:type 1 glutamine amidotransferase domain-containing protein [Candidatus Binataceae bacterium]
MSKDLHGKRIAFLVADGFEQVEMTQPRSALEKAGAKTELISPAKGEVQGMKHNDKGDKFKVDIALDAAEPVDFDALVLPGGVVNADDLRTYPKAISFVRAFFDQGKPVAAICHAPWMLVEARVVSGRTLTSWPSLQTDIRNAGGKWIDQDVVQDGQLTTSRMPDDIPMFNRKVLDAFAS